MRVTKAWQSDGTQLREAAIERRDLRPDDLAVRVDFCGVCHSDLHSLHGLTGKPTVGLVPGHEFTGTVTAAGPAVTKMKPGDKVAVGTGGIRHTAELLTFAAEHGITADVEVFPSRRVDEALIRLEKGDVRYRFVLDMSDLD